MLEYPGAECLHMPTTAIGSRLLSSGEASKCGILNGTLSNERRGAMDALVRFDYWIKCRVIENSMISHFAGAV